MKIPDSYQNKDGPLRYILYAWAVLVWILDFPFWPELFLLLAAMWLIWCFIKGI